MNYGSIESGFDRQPHARAYAPARRDDDGLSPLEILRRLRTRARISVKTAAAVFVSIAVAIFLLTPSFTSHVEILIEAPPGQVANPLDNTPQPIADSEKVASEIQVLLSRELADKAIAALSLSTREEFNPALATSSIAKFKRQLFGDISANAAIVENYYKRLRVYQVGTSRVIAVEFTSQDPQLARDAANTISELYIADQRTSRLDVNARSRDWLAEQIEQLRQRVAESEAKVEEYRAQNGLLEGTAGAQLQSQELTEINTQLSAARAVRADAEARVATLERVFAGGNPATMAEGAAEVLQSPLIQQLRASEVQLKREITELSAQLLPTHPNMIKKAAELADLDMQIQTEVQKIITSLRTQAQFSAARVASLQRDLDQLKLRRSVANQDEVVLRALEREAAADRTLLESFLGRFAEVSARGEINVQEANARVISRAQLPEEPSFPQVTPLLALALLIAGASGLGAAFIAETTDKTVRRAGDLESAAGVPVVASLPRPANPHGEMSTIPQSPYAEAIHTLADALAVRPAAKSRGRVILITSTVRGEGRTATAIALAHSLALGGLRVLLIDADLENPMLTKLRGMPDGLGFSDLVAGQAGFKHVVSRDADSSVHVISAGRDYPDQLLGSQRLGPIIDGLARAYDAVVIDSGPFSRIGSSGFLAPFADNCVYAARYKSVERERVIAGVRRAASSGARGGTGIVLTGAKA